MNTLKLINRKNWSLLIVSISLMLVGMAMQVQPILTTKNLEGKWNVRYNENEVPSYFSVATSAEGFTFKTKEVNSKPADLYLFCQLRLDQPISGLSFNYNLKGNAALLPITLLDAAANELWHFDGKGDIPEVVELKNLKVRGQLVFRIGRNQSVELPEGWSHIVTNLKFTAENSAPTLDNDGFILVDNINEFRGYACEDNVKIRLKKGPYQIDKAFCKQFIEFTGSNSTYDLKDVSFMVNTSLFSQTNLAQGVFDERLYGVMGLSGDNISMEGLYIETYGNQPGRQSRNKIFNITGSGITLKNTVLRTAGSSPWGYGSFYGLGGGDVMKMNGIRVGWPAKEVKLIGCKVHMRAMGHAIFVQGAVNTLIEDCHVDGLLRTTDDILAETSGYCFDKNFYAAKGGYVEGVMVADDGKILPGEMISLSEDGIRMYPQAQKNEDTQTGSTTIINCTVTNMRRGICTGLSSAGDKVINCQVNNCIAAGFNVGNNDTIINCRADGKYAEAVCLPYKDAQNASVELEILDSRGGIANSLLAKINGSDHKVILKTTNPSFIPEEMRIKLSITEGYGGPRRKATPKAVNIQLDNQTPAKVMLMKGTVNPQVKSKGEVEDKSAEK